MPLPGEGVAVTSPAWAQAGDASASVTSDAASRSRALELAALIVTRLSMGQRGSSSRSSSIWRIRLSRTGASMAPRIFTLPRAPI